MAEKETNQNANKIIESATHEKPRSTYNLPRPAGRQTEESVQRDEAEDQDGTQKFTDYTTIYTKHQLCRNPRVYRGYGTDGMELAVKILSRSAADEQCVARLRMINHPNIVKVVETGYLMGLVPEIFVAMELCTKTLKDFIINDSAKQPFDFSRSMKLSKQLVEAVAHMHKFKFVHRHLNPGTILVIIQEGNVVLKVTDIGFSHDVTRDEAAGPLNEKAKEFRAPELLTQSSFSCSADIFPVGLIIYFIFTNGKHAFGETPYMWVPNIIEGKVCDLSDIPREHGDYGKVRPALIKLIRGMLSHNPNERPSAEYILESLEIAFSQASQVV